MGKKPKVFKPGDYVFAKVKGYPAWPAKISNLNGKKYSIYFFGTGETGNLPANDLFDYFEHKQQFLAKTLKRRDYNEGLAQIEYETKELGLTSNNDKPESNNDVSSVSMLSSTTEMDTTNDVTDTAPEQETVTTEIQKVPKKRNIESTESSVAQSAEKDKITDDSSMETSEITSSFVNEEIESRITESDTNTEKEAENIQSSSAEAVPEAVKDLQPTPISRGRKPKSLGVTPKTPRSQRRQETVKQEIMSPPFEPHVPTPESVSRSGRKIKPKRHFEEELPENTIPQTPPKKIKVLPITPSSTHPVSEEEQNVQSSNLASDNTVSSSMESTVTIPNEFSQKRRKKVVKSLNKVYNFVFQGELENLRDLPDFENEGDDLQKEYILPAVLPTGNVVGIKLFMDWPESFASPKAQVDWTTTMGKNTIRLKEELESGKIKPESILNQLEMDLHLSPDEITTFKKEHESEIKRKTLNFLRLECKLIGLEKRIKLSLGFDSPDVDLCLQLLDEIKNLNVTRLMLLKQPDAVHLVKQVRRYVGNLEKWNYSEEETVQFNEKAQKIRKKAQSCFDKFKSLFGVGDDKMFIELFTRQLFIFQMHTNHLSRNEVLGLVEEPIGMSQADILNTSISEELMRKEKHVDETEKQDDVAESRSAIQENKNTEAAKKNSKK